MCIYINKYIYLHVYIHARGVQPPQQGQVPLPHGFTFSIQQTPIQFQDAVSSCRPVKVTSSSPCLRSFAPGMAGTATSQRTAAVTS